MPYYFYVMCYKVIKCKKQKIGTVTEAIIFIAEYCLFISGQQLVKKSLKKFIGTSQGQGQKIQFDF